MKKSLLARLAILFLTTMMLSGCLLVPIDDGYGRRGSYDRGRGGHSGGHR